MGTRDYAEKLQHYVEVDETFIGGKAKNRLAAPYSVRAAEGKRRKSKGPHHRKAIVLGMIQRHGGPVRAMTVPQTTSAQLQTRVRTNVSGGSFVYTDAHSGYSGLGRDYVHFVIDHAVRYVEGHVHTNSIENFWSCLKRTLSGTYISVQPFHLDAYLNEQVFRFNNRTDNDGGRFVKVLKATDGRRLTYAALTESHPLWRLKPGHVSAGQRKRLAAGARHEALPPRLRG